MATVAGLLSPSYSSASIFFHNGSYPSLTICFSPLTNKTSVSSMRFQLNDPTRRLLRTGLDFERMETGKKIMEIHSMEEYDKGIHFAGEEELVIVHFSSSQLKCNANIQEFMQELSAESNRIKFLHVMADESAKTRQLCRRQNIKVVPYFVFYKSSEKVHEESGFQPKRFAQSILYYRDDPFSEVAQLHSCEDLKKLIEVNKLDRKMIVLMVGRNQCMPCVRIYPNVLKLASQVTGEVVFARMNASENTRCMQILEALEISKVPAFLFLINGKICGRYIGCNPSLLIRETMRTLTTYHRASPHQNAIYTCSELKKSSSSQSTSQALNSTHGSKRSITL